MSQGKQIYYNNLRKNVNNMHPRLKELAIEAGAYVDGNNLLTGPMDDAKFAELIVRECADVLKKDMELAHIQLIPLDFKMYANGRLQRTIEEYFGFEE